MAKAKADEDPLIQKAFSKPGKDGVSQADLQDAIGKLSPEEAHFFLIKLEAAFRKRKIMLSGYLVAMVAWLVGMVCALAYFGIATGFVGWVFLVPFAIVGVILWAFGTWAEKVARSVEARVSSADEADADADGTSANGSGSLRGK